MLHLEPPFKQTMNSEAKSDSVKGPSNLIPGQPPNRPPPVLPASMNLVIEDEFVGIEQGPEQILNNLQRIGIR